jgi:hypothetical protein
MYKHPSSVCNLYCFTLHLIVKYSKYFRLQRIFPFCWIFVSNSSLMKGGELHSYSFPFMLSSKLLAFLKQSTHLDSFSFKTHSDWVAQNCSAFKTNTPAIFFLSSTVRLVSSSSYKLESFIFYIYSICLLNQSFLKFLATSRSASRFLVA